MDDYVRRPIPSATLTTIDGRLIHLNELPQAGASLLVFAETTREWLDVAAELPGWASRLPDVRVAAVVPDRAVKTSAALTDNVFLDPRGRTRADLAPGDGLMAVLLGTDDLLAGGPVHGLGAIHEFVDAIEAHLGEGFSGPRVLVTSAAMGSRRSNSVALPQCHGDQQLAVDFVSFNDATHPTRERAMHPRLAGKIPKMLAWEVHPGYDYYLWIDSCFTMTRKDAVGWFLDQLGNHDAAFFRHRYRTSISEELDFVTSGMRAGDEYLLERYRGEDMAGQVASYLADPTFSDTLLIEAGAFIYSAKIVQDAKSNVMKEWFHQNCRWSVQDQLSLPYVLHEFNIDFALFDSASIYECEYLH